MKRNAFQIQFFKYFVKVLKANISVFSIIKTTLKNLQWKIISPGLIIAAEFFKSKVRKVYSTVNTNTFLIN